MRRASALCVACALAAIGCTQSSDGADQPFRVRNAQYLSGPLPGFIHVGDDMPRQPDVTALETANLTVRQGQGGKAFSGRASSDASSIAIALDGVGSGYWVVPTGALDTATEELTWSISADFDLSIRPGSYALQVVAIDESGQAGDQLLQNLCVTGVVPDNGRACSDDATPPAAVISLQWDAPVDLDLMVVTPDGATIGSKNTAADGGMPEQDAQLDRDSNAGCVNDAIRAENVVWNDAPPEGRYHVYVNLFDACKQPSVRFSVGVYTADPTDDGSAPVLTRHLRRSGELLDIAADPRPASGLFITDVTFD